MAFLNDYFINPILSNGWYNPVNTAVYSILLIIGVYLVFRLLKKLNVPIDKYFALAVLPFIFWGSTTRVLHDAAVANALFPPLNHFYSSPLFPTPGSYIITFALALAVLLLSLLVQRYLKKPYWKAMFAIGLALDIINIILLPWKYFHPMLLILGIVAAFAAAFYLIYRISGKYQLKQLTTLFSPGNQAILSSHILDGASTFTALAYYGYLEQHVLPRFLIEISGPAVMFPLKLVVLLPVLYLIDRYTEPGNFRNFLKIVILILGLAPGLRDMIRLVAGV